MKGIKERVGRDLMTGERTGTYEGKGGGTMVGVVRTPHDRDQAKESHTNRVKVGMPLY